MGRGDIADTPLPAFVKDSELETDVLYTNLGSAPVDLAVALFDETERSGTPCLPRCRARGGQAHRAAHSALVVPSQPVPAVHPTVRPEVPRGCPGGRWWLRDGRVQR